MTHNAFSLTSDSASLIPESKFTNTKCLCGQTVIIFSIISDFDWELIIEEQEVSELFTKKNTFIKRKEKKKNIYLLNKLTGGKVPRCQSQLHSIKKKNETLDKIMFLLRKNYEIIKLEKTFKVVSSKPVFHFKVTR